MIRKANEQEKAALDIPLPFDWAAAYLAIPTLIENLCNQSCETAIFLFFQRQDIMVHQADQKVKINHFETVFTDNKRANKYQSLLSNKDRLYRQSFEDPLHGHRPSSKTHYHNDPSLKNDPKYFIHSCIHFTEWSKDLVISVTKEWNVQKSWRLGGSSKDRKTISKDWKTTIEIIFKGFFAMLPNRSKGRRTKDRFSEIDL